MTTLNPKNKIVRLHRKNRVSMGTHMETEYRITVNGIEIGSAYERDNVYRFKGDAYSRQRLIDFFKAN